MGKTTSASAALWVDDSSGTCRSISGLGNSITLTWSSEAPEVTGFGNGARERLPGGLIDWELSFDGFYGADANETDEVLSGILGKATYIQLGPGGSSSGSPKFSACAVLTSYEIGMSVEDAVTVSATFVARTGSMTRGTW